MISLTHPAVNCNYLYVEKHANGLLASGDCIHYQLIPIVRLGSDLDIFCSGRYDNINTRSTVEMLPDFLAGYIK